MVDLAFLGWGNVARALVGLLGRRREALRALHGIDWQVTGVASRPEKSPARLRARKGRRGHSRR